MRPVFAFVFPFKNGTDFRCKLNFASMYEAADWAASLLNGDEKCKFKELSSADDVFEPAIDAHTLVWLQDGSPAMYEVADY